MKLKTTLTLNNEEIEEAIIRYLEKELLVIEDVLNISISTGQMPKDTHAYIDVDIGLIDNEE